MEPIMIEWMQRVENKLGGVEASILGLDKHLASVSANVKHHSEKID